MNLILSNFLLAHGLVNVKFYKPNLILTSSYHAYSMEMSNLEYVLVDILQSNTKLSYNSILLLHVI